MSLLSDDLMVLFGCVLALVLCVGFLVVAPGLREWAARMMTAKPDASPRFLPRDTHVPTH